MLRIGRVAMVAAAGLLATACATMNVSSHAARGVDLKAFHTYAWAKADALPTGDPRLDNNPFFHDYFQGTVEKTLARKGLTLDTSGTPDLLLHYHANVTQRFSVARTDRDYVHCDGDDCEPRVFDYEAGTLVLDMVDPATNTLVWRGWAQQNVDGLIDNQAWMEEYVTKGVTKMLERFE